MYKRMRNKVLIAVIMIVVMFSSGSMIKVYAEETQEESSLQQQMDYLGKLIEFVEHNYVNSVSEEDLVEGAYKGIFNALDPHSTYYTPEEYEKFQTSTSGVFGGTGIHITIRNEEIYIIAPIEDTPADRAGIKAGDIIISVDGTDVRDYSLEKAADMIRGEIGTSVQLGIKREGEQDILYFDLVREEIRISPVSSKVMEEDIGYIRISSFNSNTEENIQKVLENFDSQGIKDIIIDLRNNPGGLLDEVVEMSKHFIPQGSIVHIDKRDGKRTTHTSDLQQQKYKLAVLVDGGSASASEIFAGAVQDTGAGTIIGTQTFGKGTVQSVVPLTNGGSVKLTIARYLTPNERIIDGEGITPDIVVENVAWQQTYKDELAPIKGDRKPTVGVIGLDVLGTEQRLNLMEYNVGEIDGIFDTALEKAVSDFQVDSGLYPYGVLDFATQQNLREKFEEYMNQNDLDEQLQKAIEVLKNE